MNAYHRQCLTHWHVSQLVDAVNDVREVARKAEKLDAGTRGRGEYDGGADGVEEAPVAEGFEAALGSFGCSFEIPRDHLPDDFEGHLHGPIISGVFLVRTWATHHGGEGGGERIRGSEEVLFRAAPSIESKLFLR